MAMTFSAAEPGQLPRDGLERQPQEICDGPACEFECAGLPFVFH
jgi:hypothetical protein